MKKVLIFFLLFVSLSGYAQSVSKDLLIANTIADLKTKPVSATVVVFVLSKTVVGDNLGATYYFDTADNTTVEDMTNLNAIKSTVSATGIWKRLLVRTLTLPGGALSMNGGKREYFVNGTTDSNGQISINLTLENTATGTAIFNQAPIITSMLSTTIATSSDATAYYLKSITSDFKTAVIQVYKPNPQSVSIAGALTLQILPVTNVGAGIGQRIKVEGIYQ